MSMRIMPSLEVGVVIKIEKVIIEKHRGNAD
jgi:hypothetical protein